MTPIRLGTGTLPPEKRARGQNSRARGDPVNVEGKNSRARGDPVNVEGGGAPFTRKYRFKFGAGVGDGTTA